MGFCTLCGKQLADGEVCSCQQQTTNVYSAATQPEYTSQTTQEVKSVKVKGEGLFSPIVDNFKDTISNPLDAGNNFYKKATIKTTITSLVTLTVLYVLTSLFNLLGSTLNVLSTYKKSVKLSYVYFGVSYKEYLELNDITRGDILKASGITGASWVQAFFFPIVYMILMAVVVVGLVYLVNALIVKKDKIQLINVAKFCASATVPIGVALVVRFLNGFIHVRGLNGTLMSGLYIAALVVALLQALETVREIITDKKKYVFALCIMIFGIVVFDYVIGNLFLGHFFTRFSAMPLLLF